MVKVAKRILYTNGLIGLNPKEIVSKLHNIKPTEVAKLDAEYVNKQFEWYRLLLENRLVDAVRKYGVNGGVLIKIDYTYYRRSVKGELMFPVQCGTEYTMRDSIDVVLKSMIHTKSDDFGSCVPGVGVLIYDKNGALTVEVKDLPGLKKTTMEVKLLTQVGREMTGCDPARGNKDLKNVWGSVNGVNLPHIWTRAYGGLRAQYVPMDNSGWIVYKP